MTDPWESSFQFRLPAIQMTIVVGFKLPLANPSFDGWLHLRIQIAASMGMVSIGPAASNVRGRTEVSKWRLSRKVIRGCLGPGRAADEMEDRDRDNRDREKDRAILGNPPRSSWAP
jgi:hypothetical protein